MDKRHTADKTASDRKPYEKPAIVTEKLKEAFLQGGCVKCQVIVGPEVGCFKPDTS